MEVFFCHQFFIKDISFLDGSLHVYIQEPTQAPKGISVYFHGLAGGPADPAHHFVFTTHFFGQSIQADSISVGNEFFADEGYYFVTFNYIGLVLHFLLRMALMLVLLFLNSFIVYILIIRSLSLVTLLVVPFL